MMAETMQQNLNFNSHTREGVTGSVNQFMSGTSDFNSHTREGVTKEYQI